MKCIVIGIDGGDWKFINEGIKRKLLPNLENLTKKGASASLRSTVSPSTVPAWPAYYSGKGPGKLGIYHWRYFNRDKKRQERTRIENISEIKLWNLLDKKYRSIIINMPATFPPEPLNGYMVAGMGTPTLKSIYTYPKNLQKEIEENIGEYSPFLKKASFQEGHYEEIKRSVNKRFELAKYLFENKNWDFFNLVFRESDVVSHHYDKEKILEVYKLIDKKLGYFISKNCNIIIMSDHGFSKEKENININQILIDENLLSLKEHKREPSKKVKIIGNFVDKPLRIFINKFKLRPLVERFNFLRDILPQGGKLTLKNILLMDRINWDETKAIGDSFPKTGLIFLDDHSKKDKIKKILKKYVPNYVKIKEKREIWKGDDIEDFPELGLISEGPVGFSSNFDSKSVYKKVDKRAHSFDGIFIACGPDVKKTGKKEFQITDITPTILHMFNLNIPKDMDGRVLKEIFKDSSDIKKRKIKYEEPKIPEKKHYDMSEKEEKVIIERLKDLGYM